MINLTIMVLTLDPLVHARFPFRSDESVGHVENPFVVSVEWGLDFFFNRN